MDKNFLKSGSLRLPYKTLKDGRVNFYEALNERRKVCGLRILCTAKLSLKVKATDRICPIFKSPEKIVPMNHFSKKY